MIRVAHIVWSAHFGGLEKLVYDLAKCQQKRPELSVSVVFAQREGEFLNQYLASGLRCHCLNLRHGFDLTAEKYRKLQAVLAEQDILHFHCFIPALSVVRSTKNPRIIYTEHGNFAFGRKARLQDRLRQAILNRFLQKRADFVSFNSRFTQRIAHQRYNLGKVRNAVVYNGIDLLALNLPSEGLAPEIAEKINGKFVIGTASRFAGFKRVDRLINAFANFSRRAESLLLLVGDGVLRPDLEALVTRLNISEQVVFAGFRRNVAAYMAAMNVCVFPSQNEPFGLVAVESLAVGRPTLLFEDAGGMVEIVQGICPDDVVPNERMLCERLEFYFSKRNRSDLLAEKRIEHAHRFNIESMADRFSELYLKPELCAL